MLSTPITPTSADGEYNDMEVIATYKDGTKETFDRFECETNGSFSMKYWHFTLIDQDENEYNSMEELEEAGIKEVSIYTSQSDWAKIEVK